MEYEIFIDESGTLADPKDQYVVIAAVATKNSKSLISLIPKARKRIPPKKKLKRERLISEFKFRSVGDKTKQRILKEINRSDVKLFVIIIDKEKRGVSDNPKNYSLLLWAVLAECISHLEKIKRIVIDQHFNQDYKKNELNREILSLIKRKIPIAHLDSLTDSRVDLADFVAGSVLRAVRNKDASFKKIIKSKIVSEKHYKWRELKSGKI